ncbi:MAG TPA: alpha,alpha-trehalase TreA [Saprospiraceae bacterium]|nr:alpha,alpha-trehalase TreA [Saprospiraceae bacterium]
MNHNFLQLSALSPLFKDVQSGGIFPDSKFFPDCTAKSAPEVILDAYMQQKDQPGFNLLAFVSAHFDFPPAFQEEETGHIKPISDHLNQLWDTLQRQPGDIAGDPYSTLLPLPYPYIVPGGRFREIYYWDSYFTMLGLREAGRISLVENMVDNFAWLLETYGHIPNGNRSYYLSRSQPPFFALMVNLLAEIKGEQILLKYRLAMEKEYQYWMDGEQRLEPGTQYRRLVCLPDGSLLNRYWDDEPEPRPEAFVEDQHTAVESSRPAAEVYRDLRAAAESGWDFSSRWLEDPQQLASIRTTALIPVDLNCLMYYLEKTLVHTYRLLPDHTPVEVYKDRARMRKAAIQQYCWNPAQGFYTDYDWQNSRSSNYLTLAGAFPLYFQIADAQKARQVADQLQHSFLKDGGLRTTLVHSGQQWDAPNGWAPLQWICFAGLKSYGFQELAAAIRQNWLEMVERTYASTGKMMEKYHVEDLNAPGGGGEYPNQDGFGWTNGVYLKLKHSF